jgi:leucyl aminopeptidase
MEIKIREIIVERVKTELLVVPITEDKLRGALIRRLDRGLKGRLSARIKQQKFSAAAGSSLLLPTQGTLPMPYLLLMGVGTGGSDDLHPWRQAAAASAREAIRLLVDNAVLMLPDEENVAPVAGAMTEGALLSGYRFNKYRTNDNQPNGLRTLTLGRSGRNRAVGLAAAVERAKNIVPGIFLARDLVNEPPSISTATYLAEQAKKHCRGPGLRVEVWSKRKIEDMNLAGLLAVNRGSQEEPRFITIRYRAGRSPRKQVALIGKGITFDSGGLSLKPPRSMETMKCDMAGAAAVIGAMSVLPAVKPGVEVIGYVPTTDNLPGGNAYKPGDVIRYLNGKTAEVLNTDAEGRLILADALALAARNKPMAMIDLATLTGACVMALGHEYAGIFGNDQELVNRLIRCGGNAGERLWQLPLVKEYREDIKSNVADVKNIGGGSAGAITAALFLHEFVDEVPWAHLDIAGPAFASKDYPTCSKGGTGFGVRTLLSYLSEI